MSDITDTNRFLFSSLKKGIPSYTTRLIFHFQLKSIEFAHGKGMYISMNELSGHKCRPFTRIMTQESSL